MGLEAEVRALREQRIRNGNDPVQDELQGITKKRVAEVLRQIARESDDQVDVVFALLDDVTSSWFTKLEPTHNFKDAATTAHIGCHVGILQRNGARLDREGRDYWIKPMREIGAIEKCFVRVENKDVIAGHPIAKSSNCSYRLANDFVEILKNSDEGWQQRLEDWISEDATRQRLALQVETEKLSKTLVNTKHSNLIRLSCDIYAREFLVGYEVIYVDDGDGDRITVEQRATLDAAGVRIEIGDAMPDVLLWNGEEDSLWVVEAVVSDGEVDNQKIEALRKFSERYGKQSIGFTTTYLDWKSFGNRQGSVKNLAGDSYVWIAEDASRQLFVEHM